MIHAPGETRLISCLGKITPTRVLYHVTGIRDQQLPLAGFFAPEGSFYPRSCENIPEDILRDFQRSRLCSADEWDRNWYSAERAISRSWISVG